MTEVTEILLKIQDDVSTTRTDVKNIKQDIADYRGLYDNVRDLCKVVDKHDVEIVLLKKLQEKKVEKKSKLFWLAFGALVVAAINSLVNFITKIFGG